MDKKYRIKWIQHGSHGGRAEEIEFAKSSLQALLQSSYGYDALRFVYSITEEDEHGNINEEQCIE